MNTPTARRVVIEMIPEPPAVGTGNRRIDRPAPNLNPAVEALPSKDRERIHTALRILNRMRRLAERAPSHETIREYAALHWLLEEVGAIEG